MASFIDVRPGPHQKQDHTIWRISRSEASMKSAAFTGGVVLTHRLQEVVVELYGR